MLLVLGPAKQVRAGKAARANDGEVRFVIVQGLYKGARNQQRAAKCGQGAEDQTSRGRRVCVNARSAIGSAIMTNALCTHSASATVVINGMTEPSTGRARQCTRHRPERPTAIVSVF